MTVKELSNVCQVHYNTMRKWLSDNNIQKESNASNSAYIINDEVILKAKKHFLKESSDDEKIINDVKYDEIIVQQLTQKDKQIVRQQEQIDHLQKLLENQQVLTLKAQERVELLEYEASSEDSNKGIWSRIFKKKEEQL